MASITVNSELVAPTNAHQCIIRPFTAGEELTVGYAVYISAANTVMLADADASQEAARVRGIVVGSPDGETTIQSGRVASVCLFGPVYGFGGMTPGAPVFNSKTAGRIDHTAPTSGAYPVAVGFALTEEILFVNPDTENPASV